MQNELILEILSIEELDFFSTLVKDYSKKNTSLKELISFDFTDEGIFNASISKQKNFTNRKVLKSIIDFNYSDKSSLSKLETENIASLLENGMAITTAHQPNLFLGPFYIFSKAISIIALSNKLNNSKNGFHYSPIFVIGSEDHDKEELLNVTLFDKKYEWKTDQIGAVGRMKVDHSCIEVLNEFLATFGTTEYAVKLKNIFLESYTLDTTLSKAMALVLQKLFGNYGLIILDIAIPEVKEIFKPVFKEELQQHRAIKNIQPTLEFLKSNYSIQASARDINIFEFQNGSRVRVELATESILKNLELHPELFSPNVILRPLMQQMVLPSIVNLGGGAEVAYWLQLKSNFDYFNIDFPVLGLRDIFTVLDRKSYDKWKNLELTVLDFFKDINKIKKQLVLKNSTLEKDIERATIEISASFIHLSTKLAMIDKSLLASLDAEKIKVLKYLELLQSKALRAEKKNQEDLMTSVEKIQNRVFENNVLRERKENFSSFYIKYGDQLIDSLLEKSNCMDFMFKLMVLS